MRSQLLAAHLDMSRLWRVRLMTLHSLQDFQTNIHSRAREVLPPIDEPLESADEQDDAESDDTVIFESQQS